jgi:hypothetical protein
MGVVVKGEEELTQLDSGVAGERVGVVPGGQVVGREDKEYPPSSIEGELDILSIISSSKSSSTSPSWISASSAVPDIPPFSLTAGSSR